MAAEFCGGSPPARAEGEREKRFPYDFPIYRMRTADTGGDETIIGYRWVLGARLNNKIKGSPFLVFSILPYFLESEPRPGSLRRIHWSRISRPNDKQW